MGSESNPGRGPKVSRDEALAIAEANLVNVNQALENSKNPATGKFLNVEALLKRQQNLTEEIEKLRSKT